MTEGKNQRRRGGPTAAIAGAVTAIILGGAFWHTAQTKPRVEAASASIAPIATRAPATVAMPAVMASESGSQGDSSTASTKQASARKTSKPSAKGPDPLQAPVKAVGQKNAPIVMEVFSDYQCPACRNLFEQTLRPLMNDYVASGKVYLVHRDFPLPMHPHGYEAARWVNAAAEAGKFEDIEGALYDNQNTWSVDGNMEKIVSSALSKPDFDRVKKFMTGCSEDVPPLFKITASGESATGAGCPLDTFIEADKALGNHIPVTQTPTYVITNKGNRLAPGAGYVSWPILKQFFDSLPE